MTTRIVAVTGASGFVGTWTMHRLSEVAGVEAVPFFTPGSAGLSDLALVERTVQMLQPAAIIHLAAVAAPNEARQDPRRAFEVNLTGTLNLAESILRYSPHTRLIFAGSSESYGHSFNRHGGPVPEDAALEPGSLYGVTKAAADLLLGQMAGEGLDVVRFRPFNHTGPGQSESYVVPAFARQIARIEAGLQAPLIAVGNLEAKRDFLDVRDVVEAYVLAATRAAPLPAGIALNLASGTARRIGDILDLLRTLSNKDVAVLQDSVRMRASDTPLAVGDARVAREHLGWQPTISWFDTIKDVLQYWRVQTTRSE